ncbi:MAG: hypothetical protein LBE01_06445, partial [Deltaproteobacteria bacterium]|nr:hypothetical protein [Deltaproteobacteria bacterium]
MTKPFGLKAQSSPSGSAPKSALSDYLTFPPAPAELSLAGGERLSRPLVALPPAGFRAFGGPKPEGSRPGQVGLSGLGLAEAARARAGGGPGLYSFACLGGPQSPGSRGRLTSGDRSCEAWLISPPGPKALFATLEPFPLAETGGRAAFWPAGDPPLPPSANSPGVLAAAEFLDPQTAWLASVGDFDPPGDEPLAPFDPAPGWTPAPRYLPLGVSFVWDRPLTGETAAQTALALPKDETLWILADSEEILAALARALNQDGRPTLHLGPALNPDLAAIELSRLLDEKAKEHAAEVAKARANLERQKNREKAAKDQLKAWRGLATLEKDLSRLAQEAKSRETVWGFLSGELASARDYWTETRPSRSFWSIFRKKKSPKSQGLALSHLEAAEGDMARARREKEALLAEAKSLREKIEAAEKSVKDYPPPPALEEMIKGLEAETRRLADRAVEVAGSFSRAGAAQAIWAEKPAVLAFPGWVDPEHLALAGPVDNLLVASPQGRDPAHRAALANLAQWPTRRLAVLGDFTAWAWAGGPFDQKTRPFSSFLGPTLALKARSPGVLAGPFPESGFLDPPDPSRFPWLLDFGLTNPINSFSWGGPWGPVWRAPGEVGPFNPVSALASAQLALAAKKLADPEDLIYVLAPSPAQGAFLRALLADLGPLAHGVAAGQPSELADWPPAALVVLDTALGQEHPWAWPAEGGSALLSAYGLAAGALALVGDEAIIETLSLKSPLSRLWRSATPCRPAFRWPPATSVTMWEALNRAQKEAIFFLPPFEPAWWTPLSVHFQAALNRQVKIVVLAQAPDPSQRKYCDVVIRDLKLFGAQVVVAQGFPDLVGVIDQRYFAWGAPGWLASGRPDWNWLWALEIPKAAPIAAQVAQAPLIAEKLGPKGFRHCPRCGWPYVLINQAKAQDFNHRQPLRLGCLNPGCANRQKPRRLDERWPFLAPPVCPQ